MRYHDKIERKKYKLGHPNEVDTHTIQYNTKKAEDLDGFSFERRSAPGEKLSPVFIVCHEITSSVQITVRLEQGKLFISAGEVLNM